MQNYYIPCAQSDRPSGQQKGTDHYPNFYRRSVTSFRQPPADQWATFEQDSQSVTPALTQSSYSSQEDDASPRTPSSSSSDELCAIVSDTSVKSVTDVKSKCDLDPKRSKFVRGAALPCRPKIGGQGQQSQNQSIIYESAVRSRLARPPPTCEVAPPTSSYVPVKKPAAVVTLNSRCHARRRPCTQSTPAVPPKLKRDTDSTDAIVRLIVCFSTKLVHAIWSESTSTSRSTTNTFNAAGVLPLRVFIQETLRRSKTSYSTLQVALFYLILLKPYIGTYHQTAEGGNGGCRALQCGRRMFLTALILASKYLQDRNYSSRAWSKISGLPITEINENERRYLNLIQFNLHMKKETFENWSKIVLTLCKVGESSMNQDLAKESSRHRLDEMSDITSTASNDEARSGSEQWWMRQLGRLTSELVQDSRKTEEYLDSLTLSEADSNIDSARLTASLDTPPSSPDSAIDVASDKMSTDMSLDLGNKVVDFTSSPSSVASLPSRPNLPNLPTPQTTPRYARTLPLPRGACHSTVRCRDSSRALTNLDRRAINVANLETCPPPQPKVHELMRSNACGARREGSSLANSTFGPGFVSSPESTVSDTSSYAPRSRSSSISSTSSAWWPSGAQHGIDDYASRVSAPKKDRGPWTASAATSESNVPAAYSFYHPGVSVPKTFDDEGLGLGSQMSTQSSRDVRLHRFQDEGYGSDASICLEKDLRNVEHNVASSLTTDGICKDFPPHNGPAEAQVGTGQLSVRAAEQPNVRKHKRDCSSLSEDLLHSHVRDLLWTEQPHVEVDESSPHLEQCQNEQLQYPHKQWACPKQPVTNCMRTKRFAMCPEAKSCSTNLASLYLRDDMTMVS